MSYSKQIVNHTVDNRNKINNRNKQYKEIVRKNAIDYMRYKEGNLDEKIQYLRNLTTDCYRHGTKYKYNCNFSTAEISSILKEVGDDELYRAYFGKKMQESNLERKGCLIVMLPFVCLIAFTIFVLNSI